MAKHHIMLWNTNL